MSTKGDKQGKNNYSKYNCFENPCTGEVHKNLQENEWTDNLIITYWFSFFLITVVPLNLVI